MAVIFVEANDMGDPFRQHPHISRWKQPSGDAILYDLTACTVVGCEDRAAHRLGLHHDTAEAFRIGRCRYDGVRQHVGGRHIAAFTDNMHNAFNFMSPREFFQRTPIAGAALVASYQQAPHLLVAETR